MSRNRSRRRARFAGRRHEIRERRRHGETAPPAEEPRDGWEDVAEAVTAEPIEEAQP